MRTFIKKLLRVRDEQEVEIAAIKTWRVSWYSTYSKYNNLGLLNAHAEFEVFTSKADAERFAKAISDAHELLKNDSVVGRVWVEANQ